MKSKILNLSLILTSLIGYLEWGGNNKSFLFQTEIEIVSQLIKDPVSAIHPFTILPLIGQILLIFTLFQKNPGKLPTFLGMGGIGVLLLFMFLIGLISGNIKILGSTVPFLVTGILVIMHHRKKDLE